MNKKPQDSSLENHKILPYDNQLAELFNEFLIEKYENGAAAETIENYFKTIKSFDFVVKSDFDLKNFVSYVTEKTAEKKWSRSTLVNHLRRLCAFNRWLFYQSAVLRLHRAPRMSNRPRWREMPNACEWTHLFESLKTRFETATLGRRKSRWRDFLVCKILFETGMRISECAALTVGDLTVHDIETFWLFVGGTKSQDAERACLISEDLTESIRAYCWTFRLLQKEELLFKSKTGKPLDTIEFCKWVKKYCVDLGISADVTPHVFRHNFILQFIASGGSALELQARLGHSDIKMTCYYFNQVRRLLPFVKANADISIFERKLKARANFFQRRNFNQEEK